MKKIIELVIDIITTILGLFTGKSKKAIRKYTGKTKVKNPKQGSGGNIK